MASPSITCPACGSTSFEAGFVEDATQGRVRWFPGPMEFGPMGNTKRAFRDKWTVLAARCTQCSRLELYAGQPI